MVSYCHRASDRSSRPVVPDRKGGTPSMDSTQRRHGDPGPGRRRVRPVLLPPSTRRLAGAVRRDVRGRRARPVPWLRVRTTSPGSGSASASSTCRPSRSSPGGSIAEEQARRRPVSVTITAAAVPEETESETPAVVTPSVTVVATPTANGLAANGRVANGPVAGDHAERTLDVPIRLRLVPSRA